jgi:GNAT superfamily N-acetyltransferase
VGGSALVVRLACEDDLDEIGAMVGDFVRGHKAEHHPRPRAVLREAYFGAQPVARLFVAAEGGLVGMGQWSRVFEMFWAMHGGRPEYLYVRPQARGRGVAAAILTAICDDVRRAGGEYLWAAYDDAVGRLYERVAIGSPGRECHLSGEAFQKMADLAGQSPREIVRGLPSAALNYIPARPGASAARPWPARGPANRLPSG